MGRGALWLRLALSAAFGVTVFCAAAEPAAAQGSRELAAANLAGVVDPPMAEWIDAHKGPGAVVGDIDPERLTQVRCDLPALEHRRL